MASSHSVRARHASRGTGTSSAASSVAIRPARPPATGPAATGPGVARPAAAGPAVLAGADLGRGAVRGVAQVLPEGVEVELRGLPRLLGGGRRRAGGGRCGG